MFSVKVNSLRIDFNPLSVQKDLDLAKCRNLFNQKGYYIRTVDYTIKYTSSMTFQIWIKSPVNSKKIRGLKVIVPKIMRLFNPFKKTRVNKFKEIKVINLQASGCFRGRVKYDCFDDLELDSRKYVIEVRASNTEPPTPLRTASSKLREVPFFQIQIVFETNNIIRINRNTGTYSLIAKNFDSLTALCKVADKIQAELCGP